MLQDSAEYLFLEWISEDEKDTSRIRKNDRIFNLHFIPTQCIRLCLYYTIDNEEKRTKWFLRSNFGTYKRTMP